MINFDLDNLVFLGSIIIINASIWCFLGCMMFVPGWVIAVGATFTSFVSVLAASCFLIGR